ncbi:MAG: hypothetical protein ACLRS2_19765 [[Clostridium] innocuum]
MMIRWTGKSLSHCLQDCGKETPLGQIIAIRSEEDPQILKQFSAEQNQLRTQWRTYCMEQYPKNGCEGDRLEKLSELQDVLEAAFH